MGMCELIEFNAFLRENGLPCIVGCDGTIRFEGGSECSEKLYQLAEAFCRKKGKTVFWDQHTVHFDLIDQTPSAKEP